MQPTSDLLTGAREGDRKAQYQLYRVCFPVLMAQCLRYKTDEQEAVASLNQGFLKILNNLDKYHREAPFEAWIRRIMANHLIDEYRKEKKWREKTVFRPDSQPLPGETEGVDWNEADRRFDRQRLEDLMHRLPPVTREVFNLFALDGFSHKEIGDMLGISDGTSKWHVNFARQKLQLWIKQELAA